MKKILFVDDEPNVLSAIQRQLRHQFQIETALGPLAGLNALQNWRDYAVVVADMGMPQMSGVEFLAQAREIAPDIVRVMLTGYVNQATAVDAINEGSIFRFLSKPCATEKLTETLLAAVRQHELITAERELLENTLGGSLKVLSEILAMAEPKSFGTAESLRNEIRDLAGVLGVTPTWDLEAAASLSQIGIVTIPPELALKARIGQALNAREKEIFTRIPAIGSSLLAHIPRLEGVARIILYQNKRFDGGGFPEDNIAGEAIPLGARMLKILADLKQLEATGATRFAALAQLKTRAGCYDPALLATLENGPKAAPARVATAENAHAVTFANLKVGHVLRSNLETKNEMLLVSAGNKITPMLMHRLRNFSALYGIQEPIFIENPMSSAPAPAPPPPSSNPPEPQLVGQA